MPTLAEVTPTAQDIADLIPRLVPDVDGTETGAFTATTNPSLAAVNRLAVRSAEWVLARVPKLAATHLAIARDVAALHAATRIARPLDAEEYDRLRAELADALTQLQAVVVDLIDGTLDGTGVASPLHSFDDFLLVSPGAERPYGWPYGWSYV